MTQLRHCILTAKQFKVPIRINNTIVEYSHDIVGKVKIGHPTLIKFMNQRTYKNPILAGICRNAFENNTEPPIITQSFIDNDLKNIDYPKSFKEKSYHLLKYMYEKGGNDYKSFDFYNERDYPICYSNDLDEFSKVIDKLKEKYLINFNSEQPMAHSLKWYIGVELTDLGIDKVEESLPKIPLIGLVDQEISTGDPSIDEKINHAKKLFFQEPLTIDQMRSSCETLSFVLEPLRQEIKSYFKSKDIEDFFNIVNNFDIRHNKDKTKEIEHPEQMEWIFYSLLNTINTYTKLKSKFEN